MNWLKDLGKYNKAVVAGLLSSYAVYQVAKGAGSPAGFGITFDEWISIVSTGVLVAGGTWAATNAPFNQVEMVETKTTQVSLPTTSDTEVVAPRTPPQPPFLPPKVSDVE